MTTTVPNIITTTILEETEEELEMTREDVLLAAAIIFFLKTLPRHTRHFLIANRNDPTDFIEPLTSSHILRLEGNFIYFQKDKSSIQALWFHEATDTQRIYNLLQKLVDKLKASTTEQTRAASAAGGAATKASAPVPTSAPASSKTIDLLQMMKSAQSQSNSVNVTPAITTPVTTPAPAPKQMPAWLQKFIFKEPGTAMSADEKDLLKTAKPHRNHLLQDSANSPSAISLAAISTRSVHGSERHQDVDVAEGKVLEPLDTSFAVGSGGQIPVLNEEQKTNQFVVDCYLIGKEDSNIHFQNRRIKFAPAHLEILDPMPWQPSRIIPWSQFQLKIVVAGNEHLGFPLVPETGYITLWVTFRPDQVKYFEWVKEQVIKMIEDSWDRQTPSKPLPHLGQSVSRSDATDSFTNTFRSIKEKLGVTRGEPDKSNRNQNASPMDFDCLENPVERRKFNGVVKQMDHCIGLANETLKSILNDIKNVDGHVESEPPEAVELIAVALFDDLKALEGPIAGFYKDVEKIKLLTPPETKEFYRRLNRLCRRKTVDLKGLTKVTLGVRRDKLNKENLSQWFEEVTGVEECIKYMRLKTEKLDKMEFPGDLNALKLSIEQHKSAHHLRTAHHLEIHNFQQNVYQCLTRGTEMLNRLKQIAASAAQRMVTKSKEINIPEAEQCSSQNCQKRRKM
ncbi:hypothetical protein GCK72_016243 [Caenorhabditis remanei]|uniref:Uncharacterized protein n=1 Tax=Caenorhabditis remanei TaxID=31234 RepID=A0A6A5GZ26_CAERE|nr:hypothetical protein GCK72_016243 [Caenorhabditis remanei]KAF1759776.1 hypothetical protein GCK72_016243 [Caenorhabditis remanei]